MATSPAGIRYTNFPTIFKQLKLFSVPVCALLLAACSSGGGGGVTPPPGPDGYEQDDSFVDARSMAVNTSQRHNHYDDIDDWIKFDAIAGYQYTISTSDLGAEADTTLGLFDSSYIMEGWNDDIDYSGGNYASNLVWTAPSTGTYYVDAGGYWGGANTGYTLTITAVAPPPQPDLIMDSMTVPSTVAINALLTFSDTITNQGTGTSGGFDVDYYISTNNIISVADTYLGSRRISSLDAAANNTGSSSFAIPGTLAQGSYYLGALIDTGSEVVELYENNNTSNAYALSIGPPLPADLTISGLSATASVPAGETITASDTVSNSGYDAYGVDVYYYLSADAIVDGISDYYVGSRTITSISTVDDVNSGFDIQLPRDFATGSYYLGAIVDPLNTVVENDDTDNTSNTVAVTVTAPVPSDLVFTSFTPDTIVNTYNEMTISDTVSNQGSGDENGFDISYYLSTDSIVDGADINLGTRSVASLAASASDSGSVTYSINMSVGTYYVYAVIDSAGLTVESSTANNTSLVTMITVVNPDLSMGTFTVSPTSVQAGDSITLSNSVTNIGSADITDSFTVRYYLSTDSTVTTGDTWLATRTIGGLAAGATNTGSLVDSLPINLTTGTYYIGAIADPYNYLYDGDTTNNSSTPVTMSVTGCSPDSYEEDDLYTSATLIGVGSTQSHNFCLDSSDWLSFTAVAANSYSIETTVNSYSDTVLELYDTDGMAMLISNDDGGTGYSSLISGWIAPATGVYYIKIRSYAGDTGNLQDYTVTLGTP